MLSIFSTTQMWDKQVGRTTNWGSPRFVRVQPQVLFANATTDYLHFAVTATCLLLPPDPSSL